MTDFRALCAELASLDGHCVVDCTEEWDDAMCRLRAALAQPEPQGPTDDERHADFAAWLAREMPAGTVISNPLWWAPRIARAVLARWGRPAIEPQEPTDEELEATAKDAEILSMKKQGGLTSPTPDGIHAQLQEQRLAGLRAVAARWGCQ